MYVYFFSCTLRGSLFKAFSMLMRVFIIDILLHPSSRPSNMNLCVYTFVREEEARKNTRKNCLPSFLPAWDHQQDESNPSTAPWEPR